MSEEKQSIWKRPWVGWRKIVSCFLLLLGLFFLLFLGLILSCRPGMELRWFFISPLILAVLSTLAVGVGVLFIRWLRRWWNLRKFLFGAACLATLIALFYAEENWRGKRAWEKCKRDLEAKGDVPDWSAYIPAPVPDEQNVFAAPRMAEWFIKEGTSGNLGGGASGELSAKFDYWPLYYAAKTNYPKAPVLVARIIVAPKTSEARSAEQISIRLEAPEARELLKQVIQDAVGPSADGVVSFLTFVSQPPGQITPRQVCLQTDNPLSATDLSQLIPASLVSSNAGHLQVEADSETNSFRVLLTAKPTIAAADYLRATDAGMSNLDLIREALRRPQIRMNGDYQQPAMMPIVNFVTIRTLAQTVAQRAQCCLLLGRPEQAFRELSFIYELRRLLTVKPTLLVSAMIDVSISGLYAETIADGLRLQAWREPDLIALQQQLREINLLPPVVEGWGVESAALCHTFQVITPAELRNWLTIAGSKPSLWEQMTKREYLVLKFGPRGWVYQNLVRIANRNHETRNSIIDAEKRVVDPTQQAIVDKNVEKMCAAYSWSPYHLLAIVVLPNFGRAAQHSALIQTKVNQALVVCGLERYHRAHGEYPETLDALVPQFVEKLPRDVIGGQPLRYRRTSDGRFLFYSVGWNQKDDAGQPDKSRNGRPDFATGDWVWETTAM